MPTKQLPADPSLNHLQHQAKDILRQHARREPSSAQRLREFHPSLHRATDHEIFSTHLTLSDAQLAIAREYGFASWGRLKHHIEKPGLSDNLALPHHERIEDPVFRRAVNLMDAADTSGLSLLLKENHSLDVGEDPNRYNPSGAHSHSTPLHQAALAGHLGVVKLLVERGGTLDIKDVIWQGTPADWAQPERRTAVEIYLRERSEARQPDN